MVYIIPAIRVLADIEARAGDLSPAPFHLQKTGGKTLFDKQLKINWDTTERQSARKTRRKYRPRRDSSTPGSEQSWTRPSSKAETGQKPAASRVAASPLNVPVRTASRSSAVATSASQTKKPEALTQHRSYAAAAAISRAQPASRSNPGAQPVSRTPLQELSQSHQQSPVMPLLGDSDAQYHAKDIYSVVSYFPKAFLLRQQQVKNLPCPSTFETTMKSSERPNRATPQCQETSRLKAPEHNHQPVCYQRQQSRVWDAIRRSATSKTQIPRFGSQEKMHAPAPQSRTVATRSYADAVKSARRPSHASLTAMERPMTPYKLPLMGLDKKGWKSPASVGRRSRQTSKARTLPDSSPSRWINQSTRGVSNMESQVPLDPDYAPRARRGPAYDTFIPPKTYNTYRTNTTQDTATSAAAEATTITSRSINMRSARR